MALRQLQPVPALVRDAQAAQLTEHTTDVRVLNYDEAATELGVSKSILYELIKGEGLPTVQLSERRFGIWRPALAEWLRQRQRAG